MHLCKDEVEHVLADGTFDKCPAIFKQKYTIHIFRSGYYIPVVHVMLPGKSKEIYVSMWAQLRTLCYNVCGKHFVMRSLLLDFELGAIQAAKDVFPDIDVLCCRFHLGQSWYRWIRDCKKFNFRQYYDDPNSEIGEWLCLFFGM